MKKILTLAFPLIISQLISMALVLTDVWMMSRISVSALAAGGLGASIYFFYLHYCEQHCRLCREFDCHRLWSTCGSP